MDAPKHVFLMLFILVDRKDPDSFFKPYYDILPATLSNMPVFWTEAELALLQGSPLIAQIDERRSVSLPAGFTHLGDQSRLFGDRGGQGQEGEIRAK